MDKVWFFFVLFGTAYVCADSALKDGKDSSLEDLDKAYYDNDWYPDELEQPGVLDNNEDEAEAEETDEDKSVETGSIDEESEEAANLPNIEEETSKNLEEEVKNLSIENAEKKTEEDDDAGEIFDANIDYQIEDNRPELRYEQKDDTEVKAEDANHDSEVFEVNNNVSNQVDTDFEDLNEEDDKNVSKESPIEIKKNTEITNQEDIDQDIALLDETKDILSKDSENDDFTDLEAEASELVETRADLADETKTILEEPDTFMDDQTSSKEVKESNTDDKKYLVEPTEEKNEDDETVDKIYTDLQNDLDKLVDTWKKLQESDEGTEENDDSPLSHEDVLDYEEKYGRPFREGVVLQQRDYDNVYDDHLFELFEDDENASKENFDKIVNQEDKDNNQEYEQVNDSNLSQIFKEFEEQMSSINEPSLTDDMMEENENKSKDETEAELSIEVKQPDDDIDKVHNIEASVDIIYKNDALPADEQSNPSQDPSDLVETKSNDANPVKEMNINELSSRELENFMTQFEVVHNNAIQATDCDGNEGPIRKTLKVDEALVISSCGFPDRYPTNKVMEWILDGAGNGMGIELNVTDVDINGALGDYLLINPGKVDASGGGSFVFSFHTNTVRMYRFLDFNRVFIRFEANPGMSFRTGFKLSVKLVEPLRQIQQEAPPEPEALIPAPSETMTVYLGGVTLQEFLSIEEEFRKLVADMATMYINANGIDPGLNTTLETTQIISRSVCNIRWPSYENCAEVKFGIPLVREDDEEDEDKLDEEDLVSMWTTYVDRDPFAARLRRMGIEEFAVPNDNSVLTVWIVIAVGVVISMVMLAFALWRFSCFEDYTRMAAFSDTDSFSNEKRGLDLYPTPHQTLPPLYSDLDYKWADDKHDDSTRVDMGGFANKSYVQEDLFNLDSDEEVIASRERSDKHLSV